MWMPLTALYDNPQSFEPIQAGYVYLFYGKAMIILESGQKAETIAVKVEADGLKVDEMAIEVE